MQHDDPAPVLSENERLAPSNGLALAASNAHACTADNAGTLFGKYVRYVAKIGGTILGRNDEVDDVIQDVFLMVHHDLHNLRNPESIKAWIATITVRVARQRLAERAALRRIREIPPFELEALAAPLVSAEHSAELSGMLQVILALPPLDRAAWVLKYIDHQPLARIARLSSCSESTAQRRIRAAETSLRGAADPPQYRAPRRVH